MAPRIGIDLLYLAPGHTGGMETYARALVPRLIERWPEAEFTVFAGRELAAEWRTQPWADARLKALAVSSNTRIRRELAAQTALAARARVDLLHSMGSTTSIPAPARVVVTIHDVIYKRHPDAHAGILSAGMSMLVPASARRARRVIADSNAAAGDIHHFLKVPRERIDVIPLGPGIEAAHEPTPDAELRQRLNLPDGPLVLSPSARRPHKNLARLIEAMRGVDATLVLPGYPTAFDDELRAQTAGARVVFAGWVTDADLEGLYASATCLAFPSLAEGFGLPVLEAMRRGLPVACSDATSLPELAGDAALLFDPLSTDAIRAAIARLLADENLRTELAAKGRERAQLFSWDRTADMTLETYRRALA